MTSTNGHVAFIWSIAERLRGPFKQHEYGTIILPLTLLRRLDQVLAPTRDKVLEEVSKYEGRGLDLDPIFKRASGQLFYNSSKLTLDKVLADPDHVATHLREYIAGFDPVVREIFEAFEFDATIGRLEKGDRLYSVLGKFLEPELDLHPERVPSDAMGDIFEELIRRFSEISNETAGEHFTPREVVRLCAELVLAGDEDLFSTPGMVRTVYDPACGTGGMLSVVDEVVRERNPRARVVLFGQELNPESWAICRAEMLVKGQDPSRIASGSTLSADGAGKHLFDYMLANPPFGVDWSDDSDAIVKEHEQDGFDGRFGPGLPRKKGGALLFLLNMLGKMKSPSEDGGSRIAIVFNGSALFTGDAGSGESEIRKWIIENDWLEAVVALPEQLFYNTGLATYIWVLSNNKELHRQGKVQLIDARGFWEPMAKSLGDKRRRLSLAHITEIVELWRRFDAEDERSKVRDNDFFGYQRIVVERPLRLRYVVDDAAIERLQEQPAFQKMPLTSGAEGQDALIAALRSTSHVATHDPSEAHRIIERVLSSVEKPKPALKKALWEAMSERDAEAPPVRSKKGAPEPDPQLRDAEQVPLTEDVETFFEHEVLPHVPDAWVAHDKTRVGYELPLTRVFFRYESPRPVKEIDADIRAAEERVRTLLEEVVK